MVYVVRLTVRCVFLFVFLCQVKVCVHLSVYMLELCPKKKKKTQHAY